MNKKTLKKWLPVCTFLYVNSYFLWYFFVTIYKPLFPYCFMKCEVSQTNDVNKPGICVFLDVMVSHMKQWSHPPQILVYWENVQ